MCIRDRIQTVRCFVRASAKRTVYLVAQDEKGRLGQIFHGEQGVELVLGLLEAVRVFGVDEEDDAGYFGEVLVEMAGQIENTVARLEPGYVLRAVYVRPSIAVVPVDVLFDACVNLLLRLKPVACVRQKTNLRDQRL